MADARLAELFFGSSAGSPTQLFMAGALSAWDPVAFTNTVIVGGQTTYTNLPVLNPAGLNIGQVLLATTTGGAVILGNLVHA